MTEKEICHVCKREKKPYTFFITNDIMSLVDYKMARQTGPICQRCDQYYAMTHEFKDASKEEFEIAKKACEFARTMLKWWTKDKSLSTPSADFSFMGDSKENLRDWEGTELIKQWYIEQFKPKEVNQNV